MFGCEELQISGRQTALAIFCFFAALSSAHAADIQWPDGHWISIGLGSAYVSHPKGGLVDGELAWSYHGSSEQLLLHILTPGLVLNTGYQLQPSVFSHH
jgi:hypothetical protein